MRLSKFILSKYVNLFGVRNYVPFKALLIFVFFFICFQNHTFSQSKKSDLPKWASPSQRDQMFPAKIFYVSYLKSDEIKPRSFNPEKEDEFKNRLKYEVSGIIYSKVESTSQFELHESTNEGYVENYSSYAKIESKVNISDCYKIETKYIKKEKVLYGIITVDKRKLGKNYIQYFTNDYDLLIRQMKSYSVSSKSVTEVSVDLNRFRNRKEVLKYYIEIISISGVKVPSSFSEQISELEIILSEINSSLDFANIEKSIKQAETYFEEREYGKALALYEIVRIKLPDDRRITYGIKETKLKLEQQYVNNANNFKNAGEYDLAVLEYEKLFIKIPEVKYKYENEYTNIERVAFNKFAKELDNALVNMSLNEVEGALRKLEKYQFVDQNKYNKYYKKVEAYNAEKLYEMAFYEYHDKLYSSSIATVKKAMKYKQDNKYVHLKDKSLKKLYQIEIQELKLTRPHVFAMQIGGAYQSHNSFWDANKPSNVSSVTYNPTFTLGLFWTHGNHERIKSSGKDASRKNLLGLRYNYVFREKRSNLQDLNEIELVIGFARYFLFNVGVSTFKLDPNLINTKIQSFSSAIAVRWYMHPLEAQVELKTYLDSDYNLFPVLKFSLVIHTKFKRKIDRHDRSRAKLNVENRY